MDLLAIQKEIHPGILAIMDGTTAGTGAGPRMLQPVVKNVILASSDQVAIDAVAAKLMGFDPLSIKFIRLAHEHGLGTGDPREIELVGADISNENWNFKVAYNYHSFLAWLAWYGPTRVFQKLLFRTPLVVIPTFIGEVEQDYFYWPLEVPGHCRLAGAKRPRGVDSSSAIKRRDIWQSNAEARRSRAADSRATRPRGHEDYNSRRLEGPLHLNSAGRKILTLVATAAHGRRGGLRPQSHATTRR